MIANTIVNTKIIGFNFSIMTNCILILLGMIVGLLVKMWNILRFVFFVKYSTPWICLNLFKLPSSKLHLKTVSRLFFNRYGLPFLFQRHMQDKRVLNTKKKLVNYLPFGFASCVVEDAILSYIFLHCLWLWWERCRYSIYNCLPTEERRSPACHLC